MHTAYLADERVLRKMPFAFYYAPYCVAVIRNYDPVSYYRSLVELFEHTTSRALWWSRVRSTSSWAVQALHTARAIGMRTNTTKLREMLDHLDQDASFRAFHEGRDVALPAYYSQRFDELLGPYATLLDGAERTPVLEDLPKAAPALVGGQRHPRPLAQLELEMAGPHPE